jgi:hypothetical protein
MNKTVKIGLGCLVAGAMLVAAMWLSRKHNEAICINQMRQWEAAAESYCLERNYGPAKVLTLDELAGYVKDRTKTAVCPNGGREYAPFNVANGPVCPNGHNMVPGASRPFMTVSGSKLAGIYEAAGWTNLIDKAEHPRGMLRR